MSGSCDTASPFLHHSRPWGTVRRPGQVPTRCLHAAVSVRRTWPLTCSGDGSGTASGMVWGRSGDGSEPWLKSGGFLVAWWKVGGAPWWRSGGAVWYGRPAVRSVIRRESSIWRLPVLYQRPSRPRAEVAPQLDGKNLVSGRGTGRPLARTPSRLAASRLRSLPLELAPHDSEAVAEVARVIPHLANL